MNEKIIWDYFKEQGLTDAGAAGLMGNLYAESGLNPINLQNNYEKELKYTDKTYTQAVDDNKYKYFVKDQAGYGIAQWAYWSRKQNLLKFAKENNKSIGDLKIQLDFLFQELTTDYPNLLNLLKVTNDIKIASTNVLVQFEKPKDTSLSVQDVRLNYSLNFYNKYNHRKEGESMEINIIKETNKNNTTSKPNRKIEYIVIHYTAGIHSRPGAALNTAKYFASTNVEASADFIVDDSTIVQYNPDIENRYSWHCGGKKQSSYGGTFYQKCSNANSIGIEICSSNKKNTITFANDSYWFFTEAALKQTIMLVKELMKRYNIDINHVIRHYDVTGKFCPGIIGWNSASGDESKWLDFKSQLNNTFKEEEEVTQEQFNTMMNNWIIEQAKKEPGEWSKNSRDWAEINNLISGDANGNKMYKKDVTREEMITIFYRFYNLLKNKFSQILE